MHYTADDWHRQFSRQARWTSALRDYLFAKITIEESDKILEIGSGTGAILHALSAKGQFQLFGLDINRRFLEFTYESGTHAKLTQGDAHLLPYAASTFEVTFCHFLLLWVIDPLRVVSEMIRVTRAGGAVCVLAEPDYGGRIDFPEALERVGDLQEQALIRQGAQTRIGRRLKSIFVGAGLTEFEAGVLGAQWFVPGSEGETGKEWEMLEADLTGLMPDLRIKDLQNIQESASVRGEHILFVPTFYASARIPG